MNSNSPFYPVATPGWRVAISCYDSLVGECGHVFYPLAGWQRDEQGNLRPWWWDVDHYGLITLDPDNGQAGSPNTQGTVVGPDEEPDWEDLDLGARLNWEDARAAYEQRRAETEAVSA